MFFQRRKLPPDNVIQQVSSLLPSAMGDDLVAVILHGEHARPGSSPPPSTPIPILIVPAQISAGLMDRLAKALHEIPGRRQLETLVMTLEELHSSTDVFPITFMEMKRSHQLLHGSDVLSELSVSPVHLRLRVEQECKNLLIRMQRDYLVHREAPRRLTDRLHRDHVALCRIARAAMDVEEVESPENPTDSLVSASQHFGLDTDVAARLNDLANRTVPLDGDLARSLFLSAIEFVSQFASVTDQLREPLADVQLIPTSEDLA